MKTTIAIVATAFGTMLSWATPTIVNDTVVPVQDPAIRRVTVPYTLVDDDAIVTLHVRKNGEEIGDEHLRRVWGDVNRRVSPGNRVLYWQPDETWQWQGGTIEISVKAWAVDNPPEYMSWDILCPTNIMYYTSSNAVPGGVLDLVYRTNKMLFRHVPAAGVTWLMGSPSNETGRQSRENQHKVTLSKDYFIGVFPVTVCQYYHIKNNYGNPALSSVNEMDDAISSVSATWDDCRGTNLGAAWPDTPSGGTSPHDVDANSFVGICRALCQTNIVFDLPTHAQHEYASRAGEGGPLPFGMAFNVENVRLFGHQVAAGSTTESRKPVGIHLPNAWGLYDVLGGELEQCLDWYANLPTTDQIDPKGPSAPSSGNENKRVVRCGCYNADYTNCRLAYYEGYGHSNRSPSYSRGVRLACPIDLLNW